jgi:hypothetical protein
VAEIGFRFLRAQTDSSYCVYRLLLLLAGNNRIRIMPDCQTAGIDLIKELRLRKWARMHYVPREKRCRSWHPIVLAEMAQKDVELEESPRRYGSASSYVPLAPAPALRGPHADFAHPRAIPEYNPVPSHLHYG